MSGSSPVLVDTEMQLHVYNSIDCHGFVSAHYEDGSALSNDDSVF